MFTCSRKMAAALHSAFSLAIYLAFLACKAICIDVNIQGVGIMRGSTKTVNGKEVDSFMGIPYAKPPTGNLRFKAPEKKEPWNGIRYPVNSTIYCPQRLEVSRVIHGKEDCLYLNVFRPKMTAGAKLPVMVWIHGGSYTAGSGGNYNGAMIAGTSDVIVVTINYRLGVLGFLNIPGTDVSGNYGLQDQILALKWTKSHIKDFGGDSNELTIFGESAGSGSVTLLLISPMAQGLFKRVIAQSGVPLNYWAVQPKKNQSFAASFGNSIGCNDVSSLAGCLRSKTWRQIMDQQVKLPGSHPVVTPVVDGVYVSENPREQAKRGFPSSSVELLLGFNKDEGTMFLPTIKVWNETIFRIGVFERTRWGYPNHTNLVADLVSYEYPRMGQHYDHFKYLLGFNDFLDQFEFKIGIQNFATAWSKIVPKTYLYYFTHMPKHPRYPQLGVAHAMELDFMFGTALYPPGDPARNRGFLVANFTEQDANVSRSIMKMWTDFAKTGNPSNSWPTYNNLTTSYLEINTNNMVRSNFLPKRMAFWNSLVPKMIAKLTEMAPACPTTKSDAMGHHPHDATVIYWLCLATVFAMLKY